MIRLTQLSLVVLIACAAPWLAAETVPVPPPSATAPAAAPAAKPSLGVKIDTTDVAGFQNGLPVAEILPYGTAATIGMQVGDPVEVGVVRGAKADALVLKGVLLEKPVIQNVQKTLSVLEKELQDAKVRAAHDPSLPELLNSLSDKLADLQRDLPKAAERFRQQYPKGRFRVKIFIDITSDATATDPVEIGVGDDDATAPAVAPAAASAPAPK